MSLQLVTSEYNGVNISFTEDGWFNATDVASKYGKRPVDWLRLPETDRYVDALCRKSDVRKSHFRITRKGNSARFTQGTWLHPKLGVRFAQWLDIDFAVWCDEQIDLMLRNKHPYFDKKKLRHATASTNKVMNAILQYTRQDQGKLTELKHYMCESKLVNWALTGEFKGLNRYCLSINDLAALAQLEERNAVLIGRGLDYQTRKAILHQLALDIKAGPLSLAA